MTNTKTSHQNLSDADDRTQTMRGNPSDNGVTTFPSRVNVHERKEKPEIAVEYASNNLTIVELVWDSDIEGKGELYLKPSPKPIVTTEEEKIKAVVDFFKSASPQSATNSLKEIGPEAINTLFRVAFEASTLPWSEASGTEPATSRPADAPPLWAERTTGREVSPVDWIKAHYGNKDPDKWDPMGLTRADIARFDLTLYNAYAKHLKVSEKQDAIVFSGGSRLHIDNPLDALARRKQLAREAQTRYRTKISR